MSAETTGASSVTTVVHDGPRAVASVKTGSVKTGTVETGTVKTGTVKTGTVETDVTGPARPTLPRPAETRRRAPGRPDPVRERVTPRPLGWS
ncbi:hypothetical protein FHS43_006008 [Streptosporangium becharense]|uniref:Uncharacterized protein n=1 Tax=Streptosporangium becharense TaxID=1816182 RepID=A0A7W9MHW8_9ACTN|nr:hypothetical protein [Streptosporangium becharense]MBB5820903.1 hypothetical protein [Streptosporangium becharense]